MPHATPVAYLARLGALDGALAVHCVQLAGGDAATLARHVRGVALCPRSNAYLGNGSPPVEALLREKVALGIGTDSSASNEGIDLFAEARALQTASRSVPASRLVRMMTLEGAAALGIDASFGSLTAGKLADVAVVRVGGTEDPEAAVLAKGGRGTIEAVMSAGLWRVREGRPALSSKPIEAAARRVTEKARAALR